MSGFGTSSQGAKKKKGPLTDFLSVSNPPTKSVPSILEDLMADPANRGEQGRGFGGIGTDDGPQDTSEQDRIRGEQEHARLVAAARKRDREEKEARISERRTKRKAGLAILKARPGRRQTILTRRRRTPAGLRRFSA